MRVNASIYIVIKGLKTVLRLGLSDSLIFNYRNNFGLPHARMPPPPLMAFPKKTGKNQYKK